MLDDLWERSYEALGVIQKRLQKKNALLTRARHCVKNDFVN